MKKFHPSSPDDARQKAPGRPSSLTKTEEQRYVTLRNWNFSQREAGALARNLPRGRSAVRPILSASTRQRLDNLHGPFAETPKLPSGFSADSLRQLPERELIALADARGDVKNRKYLEAAGQRTVVKRAKRVKKSPALHDAQSAQTARRRELPEESITYRAWHRAQFVRMAFSMIPTRTQSAQLKNVRNWCIEWSPPVELDADARHHLTTWERIAATWDGEFIADADRNTLLLPFGNADRSKISQANREAILTARAAMHSERPQSLRGPALQPSVVDGWDEELIEMPTGASVDTSGEQAAEVRAAIDKERRAVRRVTRWAGDDAGNWQVGPFDVDYDAK